VDSGVLGGLWGVRWFIRCSFRGLKYFGLCLWGGWYWYVGGCYWYLERVGILFWVLDGGVCGVFVALGWVGFVNGWVIGVICLYVVVVVSCIYLLGFRGVWYGVWDNVWLCVDWLVGYRYL